MRIELKFSENPFAKIDALEVDLFGLDLGWWKHAWAIRLGVLFIVFSTAIIWMFQGFDSGIREYGTSLHWSVFVIYGIVYFILSTHYENLGIKGSQNFVYSFSFTVLAVALFEWYWSLSYGYLYDVWLIFKDKMLLIKLVGITAIGFLCIIHLYIDTPYRLNIELSAIIFSLIPAVLWFTTGFKQTCYPQIDGAIIYLENNGVHLINLIAKITLAYAVGNTAMLNHKEQKKQSVIKPTSYMAAIILCIIYYPLNKILKLIKNA